VNIPGAIDIILRPNTGTGQDGLVKRLRKIVSLGLKLRPGTRALLLFLGAVLIIDSWLTPWYASLTWALPASAHGALTYRGYEITNLSTGDIYAKYGLSPWTKSFTGYGLSEGTAVTRSIAFPSGDFWTWVALAVLALIALEIARYQRRNQLTEVVHRRIFAVFEGTKVVVLLYIVVVCIWKGFDLTNKTAVSLAAQKALYGSVAPVDAHYVTNYSYGLLILPIGLILAGLGVMSISKAPKPPKMKPQPDGTTVAVKSGLSAWSLFVIAAIFIALTYGTFHG
jgi:hypothetical protein